MGTMGLSSLVRPTGPLLAPFNVLHAETQNNWGLNWLWEGRGYVVWLCVVSRASAHSRVSAHVPNFKGSLLQLPYKHMEFISRVSTHAGRNRELCLSAHGRLPGTLRYIHVYMYTLT